jgi:cellulose synthase operon protein C
MNKLLLSTTSILIFTMAIVSPVFAQRKQTVGEMLKKLKDGNRGGKIQQMQKGDTSLPETQFNFQQREAVNLGSVKPPKSTEILKYEAGNDHAEYEKTLDQQIRELFKLTKKFEKSPSRGELWLRLAELYVEKATLVDARKQNNYDQQLRAFQDGKSRTKPKLDTSEAKEYNLKAVQLYEWFIRDYPRDEKMSQALFFLGYNYFELANAKKGAFYYDQLTKNYPNSPFVGEAHFALGEDFFENEKWTDAYKQYANLIKQKKHRLHTFSMYKGGWCLYRMGKTEEAIKYMDFIIRTGKATAAQATEGGSKKSVNHSRLENEALRDIVVFFADVGDTNRAIQYFQKIGGRDQNIYLEKLAYYFNDKGNREGSKEVFHYLIKADPMAKKDFEYQYQIVQNYFYAKNSPQFKEELYRWINDYNKNSNWTANNQNDKAFLDNVYKLREQTLRNYVLQQHQTAQNSRAKFSQQSALDGYQLYFQEFSDSTSTADMHFFYGELLYDMNKFEDASTNYAWVAERAPTSKYAAKSGQNLLLSIEKALPKDEDLQKRTGDSIEPIPLDPRVEKFIKSATWYTQKFPNSEKDAEIKFRMGRLYYQTNNFGPAENIFKDIVSRHPKTKYSEYSANLLLDIYNLKKDYVGLEKMGTELLANESISGSKAGSDIRNVLEKANFKKAQDLEISKDYLGSAKQYQAFALQNPKSELVSMAVFNAGVNFERSGQNPDAIQNYKKVLMAKDKNSEPLKPKAKKLLAKLYQDSNQYEESANLFKQLAAENPKDPLAANYLYNAAVQYEASGKTREAIDIYSQYMRINKNKKENADITFNIAQMLRKSGSGSAAAEKYDEYINNSPDSARKVESYYWLTKLGKKNSKDIQDRKTKAIQVFQRISKAQKDMSAGYVAQFKFEEAEKTYQQLKSISIPADPQRQKKAVDQKLELISKLNEELGSVIKMDSADEIIKSLNLLGLSNEHMSQSILNAPLPKGLNEDQKKQYQSGISKIAEPFANKSKDSFKAAVDRGWDLETYNIGYRQALEKMQTLDSKTYYQGQEIASPAAQNWIGE